MIAPSTSPFESSLTIESVHGFKETVIVGPGGISPVTGCGQSRSRVDGEAGGQSRPTGSTSAQDGGGRGHRG